MSATGRLVGQLRPRTRRVVYGDLGPAEIAAELPLMVRVDQAYVVMLAGRGLIGLPAARKLLRVMAELSAAVFAPLLGRSASRWPRWSGSTWLRACSASPAARSRRRWTCCASCATPSATRSTSAA